MMLRELLAHHGGSRELLGEERYLARRVESLGTRAVIAAIASAVMFLVVFGVTRDLAASAIAGSAVVVALVFASSSLASWVRLVRLRRAAARDRDGGGNSDAGLGDSRAMHRAVM
jgi:hypothetical protein